MSHSTLLPLTRTLLRLLVIGNWLYGAAILVLLLAMPHEQWIMTSMALSPSPEADRIVLTLRLIAVVGLVSVPLQHLILRRLAAIVGTAQAGDPFVPASAVHLRAIAWSLLALQLLSLLVAGLARAASTPAHPLHLDAGFSVSGWLAVLLAFSLAGVFATGAAMREDLAGTI